MDYQLLQSISCYEPDFDVIDEDGHHCAMLMSLATKACPSSSTPTDIRPGRKMKAESKVFVSFRSNLRSTLKKDNLRTKLIRGHKKCLRELRKAMRSGRPKPPKYRKGVRCLHSVDPNNSEQLLKWWELLNIYSENPRHFDCLSRATTQFGRSLAKQEKTRNYNNNYCSWYFADELTRRSYEVYLEVIFAGSTCQKLCERFKARCCQAPIHAPECSLKWSELKDKLRISHLC